MEQAAIRPARPASARPCIALMGAALLLLPFPAANCIR